MMCCVQPSPLRTRSRCRRPSWHHALWATRWLRCSSSSWTASSGVWSSGKAIVTKQNINFTTTRECYEVKCSRIVRKMTQEHKAVARHVQGWCRRAALRREIWALVPPRHTPGPQVCSAGPRMKWRDTPPRCECIWPRRTIIKTCK